MNPLNETEVTGHLVSLKRTDQRHRIGIHEHVQQKDGTAPKNFGQILMDSLNDVNNKQHHAENMSLKMITNPDEVDTHDVSIAIAKAQLSLSITKSVFDKALRAYNDIINMR